MKSQTATVDGRISFGRIPEIVESPDLLNVQLDSWEQFLQQTVPPSKRKNQGLEQCFKMNFPITDARENYILEYLEYYVEKPKYTVVECQERGLTFAVPLKAKLRLSTKSDDGASWVETIEEIVYLGNLPAMTNRGTFIINGAERVVVSQLHRSPGVFFDETVHPNGMSIYTARIIPMRVLENFTISATISVYAEKRNSRTPSRGWLFVRDEIIMLFNLVDEIDAQKRSNRI